MVKAFEWALLVAVLAAAGAAVVRLQGAGGDALLGILGLLLFAAAASALRLGRMHGRGAGGALPKGVDWRSGLPEFTSRDGVSPRGDPEHPRNDTRRA
jgi:hypothetical protein